MFQKTKYLILFIFFSNYYILKSQDTLHYIFLGHTRGPNHKVDYRIEGIDYSTFDRIWLGGDITSESNLEYGYLEYIDSLFDVSNPSNQWAYGNHDLRNFNIEWLDQITNRKSYSAHYENGITTVVLNLFIAPDDCERLDDQFRMLKNVCDTIEQSSHLIIITHPGIWQDVPGLPSPGSYVHASLNAWIANCYDEKAGFIDVIYPMLLSVKNKGVTVVNVLGDTGAKKGKLMVSDDGIFFVASGIDHNTEDTNGPDRIVIFDHIPETGELTWKFHNLDSLFQSFQ